MSKVSAGATMSIDGYIAGPDESGFDQLFKWYGSDLAPLLLLANAPAVLEGPVSTVQGVDVTHLRYTVRYA
jgi:hypothetical protein